MPESNVCNILSTFLDTIDTDILENDCLRVLIAFSP